MLTSHLKRALGALAIGMALFTGACSLTTPSDSQPAASIKEKAPNALPGVKLDAGLTFTSALRFGDFTIATIDDANAANESDFLSLSEAMEQELVTINEVTGGGSVNTLVVTNKAERPIFILNGDLLLGGQQDRIAAESILIDGGAKEVKIPVFCVEAGRWSDRKEFKGDSAFKVLPSIQTNAANLVRHAALAEGQSAVWRDVAKINSNAGTTNSTGTFRAVTSAKEMKARAEEVQEAMSKTLDFAGAEGIAIIYKGELLAMDVFESDELFSKLKKGLVQNYTQSLVNEEIELKQEAAMSESQKADAKAYFLESISAANMIRRLNPPRGSNPDDMVYLNGVWYNINDFINVSATTGLEEQVVETFNRNYTGPIPPTSGNRINNRRNINRRTPRPRAIRISTTLGVGPPDSIQTRDAWENAGGAWNNGNLGVPRINPSSGTFFGEGRNAAPAVERDSTPTGRTLNKRVIKGKEVKAETVDKKSNRKVHRTFLRKR